VLVVDDEQDVRNLVRTVLQKSGYAVLTASSGEEALALFAHHDSNIALLLTDIRMPTMTGPELVARRVRMCG
jgi:CheY-like chemotaxis protein